MKMPPIQRWGLGVWVLLGMVGGVGLGVGLPTLVETYAVVGQVFLNLLMAVAIPLIFFNLVSGLGQLPGAGALGSLGGRLVGFYVGTTTVALALGLTMASGLEPGAGFELRGEAPEGLGAMPSIGQVFLDFVPRNIFDAFVDGKITQIVVFGALLGVALLLLPDPWRDGAKSFFDHGATLLRQMVKLILYTAPVGVGALTAENVAIYGAGLLGPLATLVGGIWLAQGGMVTLYLLLLKFVGRVSPLRFLKLTAPLYATTAATCSSVASLAVSLEIAEKRLQLPQRIYAFALPLGSQLNKDGTSIMLSAVLLFTAQAAGISFSFGELVAILLVGLILSEGSGGIPGGGFIISLLFVEAFNLPIEIAAVVGGIYRLIDMGSTTINCMGDLVASTLLTRWTDRLPETLVPKP